MHSRLRTREPELNPELVSCGHTKEQADLAWGSQFSAVIPEGLTCQPLTFQAINLQCRLGSLQFWKEIDKEGLLLTKYLQPLLLSMCRGHSVFLTFPWPGERQTICSWSSGLPWVTPPHSLRCGPPRLFPHILAIRLANLSAATCLPSPPLPLPPSWLLFGRGNGKLTQEVLGLICSRC